LVCRFDHAGAKECYKQALEIDEDNSEAWRRMAFAHLMNGELGDAIECWKKAIELDPNDPRTLNDIASALDEMGEFELAIEYYERTLKVNPDDPFARENIRLNRRILDRLAKRKD
jgi:tetratricopeptide (TPR) repeat protein